MEQIYWWFDLWGQKIQLLAALCRSITRTRCFLITEGAVRSFYSSKATGKCHNSSVSEQKVGRATEEHAVFFQTTILKTNFAAKSKPRTEFLSCICFCKNMQWHHIRFGPFWPAEVKLQPIGPRCNESSLWSRCCSDLQQHSFGFCILETRRSSKMAADRNSFQRDGTISRAPSAAPPTLFYTCQPPGEQIFV